MRHVAALVLGLPLLAQYPAEDSYAYYGRNLTPAESRGRDTWYFWTGGGEVMWRKMSKITGGTQDLLLYAEPGAEMQTGDQLYTGFHLLEITHVGTDCQVGIAWCV